MKNAQDRVGASWLISLTLVVSLGSAPASAALVCPYSKKDSDTRNLIQEFSASLKQDLAELNRIRESDNACRGLPLPDPDTTALISRIANQVSPPTHTVASLLIAGKSLACTSTIDEFGDILDSYFQHANMILGYQNSDPAVATRALSFEGTDSERVNQAFSTCYELRKVAYDPKKSDEDQGAADAAFDACKNRALYGASKTPTRVPAGSLVGSIWSLNCSGAQSFQESKEVQDLLNRSTNAQLRGASTSAAIQYSFGEVQKALAQLTDPALAANFPKCGVGSTALRVANSLVATALGAAEVLGSPWTGLAAALITKPLTNLIGMVGSGKSATNQIDELLKGLNFKDEDRYGHYVCQLLAVQEVGCQALASSTNEMTAQCVPPGPQTISHQLVDLLQFFQTPPTPTNSRPSMGGSGGPGNYGAGDQGQNGYAGNGMNGGDNDGMPSSPTGRSMVAPAIPVPKSQVSDTYKLWFGEKGQVELPNQKKVSMHDFLFQTGENWDQGVIPYLRSGKAKDLPFETVEALGQLDDLDVKMKVFKTNYESFTSGKSGVTAAQVRSAESDLRKAAAGIGTESVLTNYFRSVANDSSLTPNERALYSLALYETQNKTSSSLFDLKTKLSAKGGVEGIDVLSDRYTNLNVLFRSFNDMTGTGYLQQNIVARLLDLRSKQIDTLRQSLAKKKENIKSPSYFTDNLYPLMRDCLLGFQLSVEESRGKKQMSTAYQKVCGFLASCKKPNNSVGLPFNVGSSDLPFDYKDRTKLRPVCEMNQSYYLIIEKANREFQESQSICGKKIDWPDFFSSR